MAERINCSILGDIHAIFQVDVVLSENTTVYHLKKVIKIEALNHVSAADLVLGELSRATYLPCVATRL